MAKPVTELLSAKAFECAIGLSEVVGGQSYGWLRDDALMVVDEAERAHVVILGGDVWLQVSGRLEPAYANWSVERVGIKPSDNDVARAAEEARRSISSYAGAANAVFEFVFGEMSARH